MQASNARQLISWYGALGNVLSGTANTYHIQWQVNTSSSFFGPGAWFVTSVNITTPKGMVTVPFQVDLQDSTLICYGGSSNIRDRTDTLDAPYDNFGCTDTDGDVVSIVSVDSQVPTLCNIYTYYNSSLGEERIVYERLSSIPFTCSYRITATDGNGHYATVDKSFNFL